MFNYKKFFPLILITIIVVIVIWGYILTKKINQKDNQNQIIKTNDNNLTIQQKQQDSSKNNQLEEIKTNINQETENTNLEKELETIDIFNLDELENIDNNLNNL